MSRVTSKQIYESIRGYFKVTSDVYKLPWIVKFCFWLYERRENKTYPCYCGFIGILCKIPFMMQLYENFSITAQAILNGYLQDQKAYTRIEHDFPEKEYMREKINQLTWRIYNAYVVFRPMMFYTHEDEIKIIVRE